MKHLQTVNELFDFLKKKFSQNDIDSIESLFIDTLDEIGVSNSDVTLEIKDEKHMLDCCIKTNTTDEFVYGSIVHCDEMNKFFTKLTGHFKLFKGYDYYKKYYDTGMLTMLKLELDRSVGYYRFKILKQ